MSTLAVSSLGARLRAERECRGFTLEQVSSSTKIPVALLEALERDDLSRWPKGFYRRALFRQYVTTLGLQPEPLAGEFARLFPDDPSAEARSIALAETSPRALLPDGPPTPMPPGPAAPGVLHSLVVALVEVTLVVAAGGLLGWATGMTLLTASGAVALVYYPSIRAGAGRIRRFRKATLRIDGSTGGQGPRPTPPPVQSPAVTEPRLSAATLRIEQPTVGQGPRPTPPPAQSLAVTEPRLSAATLRIEEVTLERGPSPTPPPAQSLAVTEPRLTAGQRLRSGLARVRIQLRRLYSHVTHGSLALATRTIETAIQGSRRTGIRTWHGMHHAAVGTYRIFSRGVTRASVVLSRAGTAASRVAREWLLVAKRTIETAGQQSRRAATRSWDAMRHAAAATYRMSARFVASASVVLSRAGTVGSHAAREWLVVAKRTIETASQRSRRAAVRAWHAMRHAAVATYRMSARFVASASVVLRRAGTAASHVARKWLPVATRMIKTASHASRRAAIRAWRAMRPAAVATYRMSARFVASASVVLWRAGTVMSRALDRAARQTGRVCLRVLRWGDQAFWTAVRSVAGHAEQVAAKQLNQKSESPASAAPEREDPGHPLASLERSGQSVTTSNGGRGQRARRAEHEHDVELT